MTITVSVVIPTCDRPDLLVRAVSSVVGQSSAADEVIVVDNGIDPVVERLLPEGVRLLRIAPRAGVSAARNAGAEVSRSEYLAFLDDDDYWDVDYLAEIRTAVTESRGASDVVLARKDREVDGIISRYKQVSSLEGLRDRLMVKNPGTGGQNVVVRRELFDRLDGFRTTLRSGEDRALVIDAIDHEADITLAPRAIAVKVIHPGEQITDGRHSLESTWRFLRIYGRTMNRRQLRKNVKRLLRAMARSVSLRARGLRKGRQ